MFPQSPGSRPGLLCGYGLAVLSRAGLASEREVRIAILCGNRSPQRELGDCDVAHQFGRGIAYDAAISTGPMDQPHMTLVQPIWPPHEPLCEGWR